MRTDNPQPRPEQRYRHLVSMTRDVVFTLSPDTTILSLNPAFESLTGWSRPKWLGESFVPLLHHEDAPRAKELFQRILAGETPPPFEARVLRKSGNYLVAEFTVIPERRQ
ncbi:MAG: hypothetical protein C4294_15120, partial [Nitrospiraceae bacterium]